MQPSATASVPPANADMDLQTMQSMDWLFKKERIYLLAQFWQQRATLAEKEVTTLKEQIANNTTNNSEIVKEGNNMDRQTFETEIAAKDKEINQLLDEVQRLQTTVTKLQESSIAQISRLEEQLEHKRQHIARLEAKLDLQRDYEDLKRELSLLRPELTLQDGMSFIEKSNNNNINSNSNHHHCNNSSKQSISTHENRVKTPTIISTATTATTTTTPATTTSEVEDGSLKATTPVAAADAAGPEKSAASTPQPSPSPLLNGNPKSPLTASTTPTAAAIGAAAAAIEDNNNHHMSNNNLPPMSAATMCPASFDALKSPYRFEDHRSPFRFAEDLGMAPGSMVSRLGESLIPKGDPMEAKLQEMLRYNMDKYASQNLDTLHIARRVRELLSIHNIGQRLFAKYILGLSQGTVSELLSKPKPWDKLTEKGRDSYRKMHAWACDEQAILLLKSLIPKKGKDTGMPTFGRPESDMTEERLAHILNEANQFQQLKSHPSVTTSTTEDSHSNDDSKSPHGQCLSPFSKDSSQNRRLKKYENDDIPQEKVVRIYQEELAKLMGRRFDDVRGPRDAFPGMFFPQLFTGPGQMDRTQEEIRMALDAYHREILKLNQGQGGGALPPGLGLLALQQQALQHGLPPANGGVQDLSLPKDKKLNGDDTKEGKEEELRHAGSAFSLVRPKLEPGAAAPPAAPSGGSTASSPLGNAILPPAMAPSEDFGASAVASPLQRMASITNSLISQPPTQPHTTATQRPLKAVLPPITQQQFDQYNNLNTEDIVKKVKEQLSQYSISQRLFGESVLGLSQGSVSDLLARPKPWHMLTQKGREPFIRMKMFLEDDGAVHRLVASQYKIAPEKLMRTGGYGGGPSIGKPMPPTQKMLSDAAAGLINKMQETQGLLPPALQLGPPQGQGGGQPPPPPPPMLLTPPGVPPHHAINLQNAAEMKKSNSSPHAIPHSPIQHQVALRNMHQHMSPSVYEMAALTQDLDTQVITTKIKEALLANNIGQKIFGEAVLGLSQGSVSELLSKPKPWHMLSIKGREPFIRMQLWLNDTHNIDRLQAIKNERREANKRRRSSGPGAHDNSSDTSSNDTSEFYHSNSPGPGPPSAKKQRVLFSEEQKEALRLAFALDPYPNVATIEFLAGELGLSSRTITNWFHNHRMRLKQQVPHGMAAEVPPRDQSAAQGPFDPVQFRLLLNQRLLELSKERMGLGAVPLPYPPYHLAANTNLAALISRGLLPAAAEMDLAALNNAVKEQMSGLDLSMTALKREPHEFDDVDDEDDEVGSNVGSEDSQMSGGSLVKVEPKGAPPGRSSRRKPAAPQWVNPEWQDEKKDPAPAGDEVIINGVCVMQTEDYGRRGTEETVRVEPTPVLDRFDDDDGDDDDDVDDHSDVASLASDQDDLVVVKCEKDGVDRGGDSDGKNANDDNKHLENEDERWDY